MASKKPNRYFDMKGNEYDYDYFSHCFAAFATLVAKANKIIPGGIEEEFIKYLIKDNKYFYKAFLNIPYVTLAEKNTKSSVLSNIKDSGTWQTSEVDLYYRASFFGAGVKEICRIWLERDCKETPEQMALILFNEYTNRNQ